MLLCVVEIITYSVLCEVRPYNQLLGAKGVALSKIVIFGNSGSGKSTLAKSILKARDLSHLDLDIVAWKEQSTPERLPIHESEKAIDKFLKLNSSWVIEGCYSDLLALVLSHANELIFLNLPIDACIKNAKSRPWEPHKYQSKKAQDANLPMLLEWISQYNLRNDTFSRSAHESLFQSFKGKKAKRQKGNVYK